MRALWQYAGLGALGQEHQLAALPPQYDGHALPDLCKVHHSIGKITDKDSLFSENHKMQIADEN